MTKHFMSLAVFFSSITVIVLTGAELAKLREVNPFHAIHDKPTACLECQELIWTPFHTHRCSSQLQDVSSPYSKRVGLK
jgi:hypothetical protein